MKIVYTQHLLNRINLRKTPYNLPRETYEDREQTLFDNQTNHFVALSKKEYFGKLRILAVTFDKIEDRIELITIHPIEEKDKVQRVKSGRWAEQ